MKTRLRKQTILAERHPARGQASVPAKAEAGEYAKGGATGADVIHGG